MEHFAHSPRDGFPAQSYKSHVEEVSRIAKENAKAIQPYCRLDGKLLVNISEEAALWHDLGKLEPENQLVLSGKKEARTLPKKHWDAGAALLRKHNPIAAAAVYSHHTGYPNFVSEIRKQEQAFRVSEVTTETDKSLDSFEAIHNTLLGASEFGAQPVFPRGDQSVFLRILLSCVADADHRNTAHHYGRGLINYQATELLPDKRLEKLNEYVDSLSCGVENKDERATLRSNMYAVCRDADTPKQVSISSCDSSVGSGKTTAVMAHLLTQAQHRRLRRIFVILPFTNIIRQSVDVYREALTLPGEDPKTVVAELHHRAEFENVDQRQLTALWKAPLVVTTSVAFFETLAANTPASLRRLHELPGSAVFVDEAHAALPAKLLPIAWRWMNLFAKEWGCYWLLASGSLSRFWQIPEISQDTPTIDVPEIVDGALRKHLGAYEKNRVRYCHDLTPKSAETTIQWVKQHPGPRLVIVNTVNNAAVLAAAYKKRFGRKAIEHLSTALAPYDRDKALERVKERLRNPNDGDWTLIATSCVEAGVDFSFRVGFRELGSLASLLQVAGRVNREGKYENSEIWTFKLTDSPEFNTNPAVRHAAEVLEQIFTSGAAVSQELCTDAISDEIRLRGVSGAYKEMLKSEKSSEFRSVAEKFKVIDADTRFVVINPSIAERVKSGDIYWPELQENSVRIWGYKLAQLGIPLIADDIYLWNLGYDDFLGYMAGLLSKGDPSSYIV